MELLKVNALVASAVDYLKRLDIAYIDKAKRMTALFLILSGTSGLVINQASTIRGWINSFIEKMGIEHDNEFGAYIEHIVFTSLKELNNEDINYSLYIIFEGNDGSTLRTSLSDKDSNIFVVNSDLTQRIYDQEDAGSLASLLFEGDLPNIYIERRLEILNLQEQLGLTDDHAYTNTLILREDLFDDSIKAYIYVHRSKYASRNPFDLEEVPMTTALGLYRGLPESIVNRFLEK